MIITILELIAIIKTSINNPFLVLFFFVFIWIKRKITKNKVGTIKEIPPSPKTKFELTLSNPNENKSVVTVYRGIAPMMNL